VHPRPRLRLMSRCEHERGGGGCNDRARRVRRVLWLHDCVSKPAHVRLVHVRFQASTPCSLICLMTKCFRNMRSCCVLQTDRMSQQVLSLGQGHAQVQRSAVLGTPCEGMVPFKAARACCNLKRLQRVCCVPFCIMHIDQSTVMQLAACHVDARSANASCPVATSECAVRAYEEERNGDSKFELAHWLADGGAYPAGHSCTAHVTV
jgi:hypothetical protein